MADIISRREAHLKGASRFYSGTPCKRGHDCERFVANGNCVECASFKGIRKRVNQPSNIGWPSRGLVFQVPDSKERPILPEEIQAAFLYLEAKRWHDAALIEVRKNPELVALYSPPLTTKEQSKLQALLERDRRTRARLRGEES